MSMPSQASATPPVGSDSSLADWVEELANRLQAGEWVDLSGLAREFPERADELRRLLPAIELMAEFGRSAATGPVAGAGPRQGPGLDHEHGVLGDFRIVREVGRGGMGVVYEAEQLSLRRRVALKILPFAAAMDARQLQRFQLEAQAAACLHHTNIVPVHAVGSERGVPYYAMQFIEGRSLAQIITELRHLDGLDGDERPGPGEADSAPSTPAALLASGAPARPDEGRCSDASTTEYRPDRAMPGAPSRPAPPGTDSLARPARGASSSASSTRDRAYIRNVASMGLQAAEALDHAHTRGILHRDIKPGNLILDTAGQLWVTDFGLAQVQGDSRLTLTGDVLGTLRYMSPEQATARRVVIDGRTDIYSLGVTLYELLTLRPAIDGKDRAEILRRVAQEEPTPPRRHNPAVPRDLETIVQKAMAKEPGSRYATAREFADDLCRFLEDRPIAARRPSVPERAARWMRRHPSVTAATAIVLVLAALGSAIAAGLLAREQAETAQGLEENQFWKDVFFQTDPFSGSGATLGSKQLLEKAREMVAGRTFAYPIAEARIQYEVGRSLMHNGRFPDADPHLARALDLMRRHLGKDDRETLNARRQYAYISFKEFGLGEKAKGIPEFREVLAIQRRILGPDHPDVIETTWCLADVLLFVNRQDAVRLAEQTVETARRVRGPEDRVTLLLLYLIASYSGDLQGGSGRRIQLLEEVARGQEKRIGRLSKDTLVTRSRLGWERWASGDLRGALGEYEPLGKLFGQVDGENNPRTFTPEAIPCVLLRQLGEHRALGVKAAALYEKWPRLLGERHDYVRNLRGWQAHDRGDLVMACRILSDLWARVDQLPPPLCRLDTGTAYAESLAWSGEYEQAVRVAEAVLDDGERRKDKGEYTENHYMVAAARDLAASVLAASPDVHPASGNVDKALDLAERNVGHFPHDGQFRTTLGLVQYRAGRWPAAIATLEEADLLDDHRRFAPRGFILAMAHWKNGDREKARELFRKSVAWMDDERPGHPEVHRARAEAAALLGLAGPGADEDFPPDPFKR